MRSFPTVGWVFLLAVTLGVYARVGGFEFLHYDDDVYVTGNPRVTGGLTLSNLFQSLGASTGNLWHPVTLWSHQVCHGLFGPNPGAHHLANLALHLATIGAVVWWLRGHGARGWPLWLAVAVWAFHPHRVEVVAWISARKDLLATPACLAALALLGSGAGNNRRTAGRLVLAVLAIILALGSKPSAVVLPGLIIIDQWMRRPLREIPWKSMMVPLAIACLGAGAVAVGAILIGRTGGHAVAFDQWDWVRSLKLPPLALVESLRASLLPLPTELMRAPPARISVSRSLLALLLPLAVSVAAVIGIRKGGALRLAGLGWFWFFLCLAPVSGIVPTGNTFFADRYTYLAHLGFLPALTKGMDYVARSRARIPCAICLVALLAIAATGSAFRCREWRSDLTLFGAEVARHPDQPAPRVNFANALDRADRGKEAERHYRRALENAPRDYKALHNLAALLVRTGSDDTREEAISLLERALPSVEARDGTPLLLVRLFIESGRINDAGDLLGSSLDRFPQSAGLHDLRGQWHASRGEKTAAARHFRAAISLDPVEEAYHRHLRSVEDGQ